MLLDLVIMAKLMVLLYVYRRGMELNFSGWIWVFGFCKIDSVIFVYSTAELPW